MQLVEEKKDRLADGLVTSLSISESVSVVIPMVRIHRLKTMRSLSEVRRRGPQMSLSSLKASVWTTGWMAVVSSWKGEAVSKGVPSTIFDTHLGAYG